MVKNIDSNIAVRALGRLLGEPLLSPAALGAGWGILLYPEIQENRDKGATSAEYAANFLIDGGGFWGGELVGWLLGGVASETGSGALVAKLGMDVFAGSVYDTYINSIGGREKLTEFIQSQVSDNDLSLPEFEITPVPRPTPEPVDAEEGVYDPNLIDKLEEVKMQSTPVPSQTESREPEKVMPVVTQTPEPIEDR